MAPDALQVVLLRNAALLQSTAVKLSFVASQSRLPLARARLTSTHKIRKLCTIELAYKLSPSRDDDTLQPGLV
jgi:hypothetical protein